ncbi:MAG: hypothetical protein RJA98_2148 [Pseudomonadota bacterium]
MDPIAHITLDSLKLELRSYYAALAVVVDDCFEAGAGDRMLGVDSQSSGFRFERLDIDRSRLGALLPTWYRYAYEGVLSAGYSPQQFFRADGAFERLGDLLTVFGKDNVYLTDAHESCGVDNPPAGHLADLAARLGARASLDTGCDMTLQEIALLADMNERSVRNATTIEGTARLEVRADGRVVHAEALGWLAGRRGFKPTDQRVMTPDLLPSDLLDVEIPIFVTTRLRRVYDERAQSSVGGEGWLASASLDAGIPIARIQELCELPLKIHPRECAALARAMCIDPHWFTLQVMSALYPEPIDMLLNPRHWRNVARTTEEEMEPGSLDAVTITLTPAMLKHGYVDIPMSAKKLFPNCEFGSREREGQGGQVEFLFGMQRVMTDIRQKSQQTLSPRKRFTAWLNTELGAKPGDRIRIDRIGDSQFRMSHQSV